jgi:cysteine protease ATG4
MSATASLPHAAMTPTTTTDPILFLSSTSSRSSNEEAVLITGPTLTEDRGVTVVQAESCENVSLWSSSGSSTMGSLTTTTPTMLLQKLASQFGLQQQQQMTHEEKELEELESYSGPRLMQPTGAATRTDHFTSTSTSSSPATSTCWLDRDDHSTPLDQHYFNETAASLEEAEEEERISRTAATTARRSTTAATGTTTPAPPPPTYILGVRYDSLRDFDARRADESYLFWFTYRCDFPAIQPYAITSDAGWGCMLRATQMLLAQALRLHYNGRDWKPLYWTDPFVQSIYTWFADFPSTTECFYSLHNMVATGMAKYDKLPGEWFGPSTASFVLRDLVLLHAQHNHSLFRVHVASGGTVVRDELARAARADNHNHHHHQHHDGHGQKSAATDPSTRPVEPSHPLENAWQDELLLDHPPPWDHSLLLLIPLRLGLRTFHKDYVDLLAHTFSFPQSVGVLGGRPRGARWFYGSVGAKVLGLDPHTVQAAPKRNQKRQIDIADSDYQQSLFSKYPEVCAMASLDPSIALGFYCKTRPILMTLSDDCKPTAGIIPKLQNCSRCKIALPTTPPRCRRCWMAMTMRMATVVVMTLLWAMIWKVLPASITMRTMAVTTLWFCDVGKTAFDSAVHLASAIYERG